MTGVERDDLEPLLEQLESEERDLSAFRRQLHDRLASFPNEDPRRGSGRSLRGAASCMHASTPSAPSAAMRVTNAEMAYHLDSRCLSRRAGRLAAVRLLAAPLWQRRSSHLRRPSCLPPRMHAAPARAAAHRGRSRRDRPIGETDGSEPHRDAPPLGDVEGGLRPMLSSFGSPGRFL